MSCLNGNRAKAIVQDYAAVKKEVTRKRKQISCLPDSSVHQVRYGARLEVELMVWHKAVLGILPRAYILCI